MHSKPQKRTAERLTCRESSKSCLPAKTKARARMPPPFLQPSCALRSRFEAVLKGVRLIKHAGSRGQESDCADDADQNEKRHDDELRDFQWRLGLRRSHRFHSRHFFQGR